MKKVLLLLSIVAGMAMMFLSCTKEHSDPNPTPTPTALVITAKASPDTVLSGQRSTVDWTANKPVTIAGGSGNASTSGSITTDALTVPGASALKTISLSANGYSETGSASVSIYVWSQKTTQLQGYAPLHIVSIKSCIAGTENSPTVVWIDGNGAIDPNFWIKFTANGGGQTNLATYPAKKAWAWADSGETSIAFGIDANGNLNEIWNVTLLANGFDRTQIKNGYYTIEQLR